MHKGKTTDTYFILIIVSEICYFQLINIKQRNPNEKYYQFYTFMMTIEMYYCMSPQFSFGKKPHLD